MGPTDRVVVLIDMDCFYCQVEEKLDPRLKDKPIAVVQYNAWRGGGIIAVNYPAREQGVTRHMRGNDAKKKCPSINLVRVPEVRGKADLTKYREAGKEVADVLATFTPLLERASVDEAYLDITEAVRARMSNLDDLSSRNLQNTFVVGYELEEFLNNVNGEFTEDNLMLAVGGLITEEIRREVYLKTGYRCSAGIAHNKILAKLVCSLHKPNKQTILPHESVDKFFETMPINKIKSLGGKFGQSLAEDLNITYMGQLKQFTEKELRQKYEEKTATWLYNIARGVDFEPVTTKLVSKSIACCKNFTGNAALTTAESVQHWLNELADELSERLDKDLKENGRKAKQMVVSFSQEIDRRDVSSSRTQALISYEAKKIAQCAFELIRKFCQKSDGGFRLKFLGLSAGHFEDVKRVREITTFFKSGQQEKITSNKVDDENKDPIDVYQQLTQELDENTSELIFFDDSCRIKSEIEQPTRSDETHNLKSSFFKQYFDQGTHLPKEVLKPDSENKDKVEFDEMEEICSDEMEVDKREEVCSECGKSVPVSELISHKDYHFALKLAENNNASNVSPNRSKKQEGNLMAFFNTSARSSDPSEPTETCTECNKKIKIDEFSSHLDYHVAKRIHLELNAASSVEKSKSNKSVSKNKTKKGNHRSVTSFFKRL